MVLLFKGHLICPHLREMVNIAAIQFNHILIYTFSSILICFVMKKLDPKSIQTVKDKMFNEFLSFILINVIVNLLQNDTYKNLGTNVLGICSST